MPHRLITRQDQLEELCTHIREAGIVGFDTEFVAEYYYRPRLCLLQFATPDRLTAIDPFEVDDLSPWWELMTDSETTVVVHGGREEVRFCHQITGQLPQRLVDVQIVEGLLSRGYPLSYTNLVQRVVGDRLKSHETRTEWRRRPLTSQQVDYALDDVRHLIRIWECQQEMLSEHGRSDWAEVEVARFIEESTSNGNGEPWRRLSGVHRLSRRALGCIRELFEWRERLAEQQDRPVRGVLRDDLLVEVAKRQPRSRDDVTAIRGMQRRDYAKFAQDLLDCVERAAALSDKELPAKSPPRPTVTQNEVLGKMLSIALAQRCAECGISTTLVGTNADLQELVRWYLSGRKPENAPRLAEGWRGEVCGDLLGDVLAGKVALRIVDPAADAPLRFERLDS
ncbi:MAG: ribonuclease D [Planctomycetota bacterium]|nr:MAG: ribonuclease D [Planctomycetota bacterium]REJ97902.1 MAG: ribonuclease D [Planctomycetota bacterium]REK25627.1 MAG: ribonuclease D [Planctomycetota bacterium]REK31662.1 MAG: ribonuclease D [Planctomycetota bacterium]